MRQVRWLWSILAILSLVLAACSSGAPSGPTTGGAAPGGAAQKNPVDDVVLPKGQAITFWHAQSGPAKDLLDSLVDDFNKNNEYGIKVNAEFAGNYTQVYQKILAALQAGSPPDFAVAYESMASDYQKANKLAAFDDYVASTKYGIAKDDLSDYVPAYLAATKFSQFNNAELTFPFAKSAEVMYTNLDELKKLGFSKPAETWDEFLTHLRAHVKAGKKGYDIVTDASNFHAMLFSLGGEATSADGKKVLYDTPEAKKLLGLYETMYKEKLAVPISNFDDQNDLAAGNILYMIRTTSSIPFVRPLFNDESKWAVTNIPQGDPKKPATVLFGGNVSIFKTTPEKQLASWLFIKYWTSKTVTAKWGADKATGYFPVRLSAFNEPAVKAYVADNPKFAQAFEVSKSGKVEPSAAGSQEVRTLIAKVAEQIFNGQLNAEQASKELTTKGNQILADNQ